MPNDTNRRDRYAATGIKRLAYAPLLNAGLAVRE